MSFTASFPACVSVNIDVVDSRSMHFVLPWNFTPQPFGLSQSPSSVVATAASSEATNDNLVIVEVPVVETLIIEGLLLRHWLLRGCCSGTQFLNAIRQANTHNTKIGAIQVTQQSVVEQPEWLYLFIYFHFHLSYLSYFLIPSIDMDIGHIHKAYSIYRNYKTAS